MKRRWLQIVHDHRLNQRKTSTEVKIYRTGNFILHQAQVILVWPQGIGTVIKLHHPEAGVVNHNTVVYHNLNYD